ncbi:hypothetical protein ACFL1E_07500 [Candidatus Omnitrophota bacterium]
MIKLIILLVLFTFTFTCLGVADEIFIYDSKNNRDPFVPLVTSEGYSINFEPLHQAGNIKLEGITYDAKAASFAIINGQVMKVGDEIGTFEILEIDADGITVSHEDKKMRVNLRKEE